MNPDCTSDTLTSAEYLQCTQYILNPVIEAILPICAIIIMVNILFAGIMVAKKTVNGFTGDFR